MLNPSPTDPRTLDLCCGGKRCPVLTDDGEGIVIEDAAQSPAPIRIAKADVPRVLAWLAARVVSET